MVVVRANSRGCAALGGLLSGYLIQVFSRNGILIGLGRQPQLRYNPRVVFTLRSFTPALDAFAFQRGVVEPIFRCFHFVFILFFVNKGPHRQPSRGLCLGLLVLGISPHHIFVGRFPSLRHRLPRCPLPWPFGPSRQSGCFSSCEFAAWIS